MKNNLQRELIKKIKKHVLECFQDKDVPEYPFHNKAHTIYIAEKAAMLADHYQLNDEDYAVVMAAAWFHDIGYLTVPADHEQESARLAEDFLLKKYADIRFIAAVKACIRATKIPQTAADLNQQIVCDADLFGLGTDDFFKNNKLLRRESMLLNNREISKTDWRKDTAGFLEQHTFYTDYCRLLLDGKKAENLAKLKEKIQDEVADDPNNSAAVQPADALATIKSTGAAKKERQREKEKPEKGIETMFRISSGNHQRLSDMADKKAHIMITVNSIIISAVISLVFRKLDTYGFLVAPSFILLSVSLAAMTFSILSTRPSLPHGRFAQSELDEKKVNLLFFGNFYKMGLEQYAAGMQMMMEDGEFLYGSLIRDGYAQGVVLGRKYHLLRLSYSVFMYGLIAAVIAFMLAYLLSGNKAVHIATVPAG